MMNMFKENKSTKSKKVGRMILIIILLMVTVLSGCLSEENQSKGGNFEETEDQPDVVDIPNEGDGNGSGGNDDNSTSEEPEPETALCRSPQLKLLQKQNGILTIPTAWKSGSLQ
jgi:hypothetical protein